MEKNRRGFLKAAGAALVGLGLVGGAMPAAAFGEGFSTSHNNPLMALFATGTVTFSRTFTFTFTGRDGKTHTATVTESGTATISVKDAEPGQEERLFEDAASAHAFLSFGA